MNSIGTWLNITCSRLRRCRENRGRMANLQIVTTPTRDWLAERAHTCSERMLVGSPYVNDAIIELTDMVSNDVTRTLVTRTDLRDFAVGASSLDTLCTLVKDGVAVHSLSDLHAKIYVFDDSSALVTSANATRSGMRHNLECGLGTQDARIVKALACSLMSGLGTDMKPQIMNYRELEALYAPLEQIKVSIPKPLRRSARESAEPVAEATFLIDDKDRLVKRFSGWKRLTLEGVLSMSEDGFNMDDLLGVCAPIAARRYPGNYHVREKLRQQLQLLRNLGIVEFVTPGNYKRTLTL